MQKRHLLLAALASAVGIGACAQPQTTPPAFNGGAVRLFMARMTALSAQVAVEQKIPYDSLSAAVGLALRIDTLGRVTEWRYMDNTAQGRDHQDYAPATPATRRLVEATYEQLNGTWSPAVGEDGRAVNYDLRMTIRIPVEKIEREQNPDPLLFLGQNPKEAFFEWSRIRVRYDSSRFPNVGGVVRVRFYIEPDGRITVDEVLETPDARLAKEVVRVIRSSKGKWTPRKVRGVPQRTAYEFRCNYVNEGL